ncbi:SGNH/GDSL hydrolase family protein [Promicromonospora sukumoe]|uniref:Lysophospholipase L1-like esterase n=1 Tax=Promicromonospora sukumoe TaxID=88382 RepID=A0A7W3J612_9MICO|nr:GDSL-type esterase/lipase family protein [Promicromonospora sukumoe]MBA8806957.1 lysophospholipase L1-like esterase [Promicromonospora sukumoe]
MTGTAPLARRTLLTGALASTGALLAGPAAVATPRTLLAAGPASDEVSGPGRRPTTWVPSWTTAHTRPTASDPLVLAGATDQTVRHVLRLSAGTTSGRGGPAGAGRLRVRLAGTFSERPVQVGAVTVARRTPGLTGTGPGVDPATVTPVTFGGARGGLLAAGATLVSDPVTLAVPDGGDLVVSVHLPGPTGPLSFHRNVHATGYVATGDRTGDDGAVFTSGDAAVTRSAVLLSGVDVDRPGVPGVAVLGDSITEGVGTPDDADQRLTDHLARRLAERGGPVGVANLGISGNRVLLDDERFGPSGQARLDRDALALPGVDTLLVVLGVNDLQQPPSQTDPDVILAGYRQLVLRARDRGLRVVGTTITPFGGWQRWTPALEEERRYVNAALLAGTRSVRPDAGAFDAVAGVAAAVADPADPARLLPAHDSGDGLHPSAAGAAAMAAAIGRRALLG